MASSNQNPNVKEIPSSSSICVKSPSIIRTVSSPGRMIWLRKSAAVLRRHWRNSLTSAALPLLREYDCHERAPVDLDAERDGVRRNRRESMSRAKTLVTGATGSKSPKTHVGQAINSPKGIMAAHIQKRSHDRINREAAEMAKSSLKLRAIKWSSPIKRKDD